MTENNNTNQFVKKLAEREKVSEEKIKEIIIDSLCKSYCQGENAEADLHFEFDTQLLVYRTYKIVEKVNHPGKEVEQDSKLLKENKVKGEILFLPLDIKNFSISLNDEIKERLRKDIREIQGEKQYKFYKSLQGKLVEGNIQGFQENYYVVNLGKGTGYWDKKEWLLPEKPRLGQRFSFLIKEVREKVEKNVPQIIVTRQDDLFLRRLLELGIPEIREEEGIIVIKKILRVPGLFSKLVVESKKMGIDPLGTCIGRGAVRIQTISKLLYPEKLDIAPWSEDKKEMLFNLLSPVKPVKLTIEKGEKWEIIVSQQKASLLLQHEGKILKKISEYLGVSIHAKILEEMEKNELVENKGEILQKIGNYRNIDVQILEEIEKKKL